MNEALLLGLMSPNNDLRNQAEPVFEQMLTNSLEKTLQELLVMFATQGSDVTNRAFAGILLRREIEKRADNISAEAFAQFRGYLVQMWGSETDSLLLKRLCHVIAQVAMNSNWSDLIPLILGRAATAGDSAALLSALSLLETLAEYCPEDIVTHIANLSTFLGGFLVSADPVTQIACARATGACIISIEDDAVRGSFRPALEPIINVLGIALGRGDELDAQNIMEHLVTIAQIQPAFFKGSLDGMVHVLLQVASTEQLEFATRSIALELMVTITETAPALARRCAGLLQGLVPLAMSLMLEVDEEEEEFVKGVYSEEEPADENSAVGDEAIERVAGGLGGKSVADLVLQMASQFMVDANWKKRRAAVSAMARLAEGCTKYFKKHFDAALTFLSSSLNDPSARVKFEGIQTIGRFADLYPEKISVLIENFVPVLTALLQEGTVTCARVRGHCASALINLVNPDVADSQDLSKHLQPLLASLVSCFSTATLEVQAPCLVLLGCVAQVSNEAFAPYYPSFMPGIKSILHTAVTPELETLRGKAMECAGLIGDAVGVTVFAPDALEIMQIFIQAMQAESAKECNDTTLEYILPACARISKALKGNFSPFLPVVMPPCLAGATADIQFSMVDADFDDAEGEVIHDDEAGTESTVISLGAGSKKRVTLNTHAVQQKKQAARIIFEFADSLGGHLGAFIIPCIQATMTLCMEKHSGDIRSSATLALAKLFECYLKGVKAGILQPSSPSELTNLGNAVLAKLLECIKSEISRVCRGCAAEGFKNVLLSCYNSGDEAPDGCRSKFMFCPSLPEITTMAQELFKECGNSIARRANASKRTEVGERFDAEDVHAGNAATEEVIEEEDDILSNLTDAIGQALKLHGEALMPVVETFLPALAPYAASAQPQALQIVAISFVDDVIEFGGASAHKFVASLLPIFMNNAVNVELELTLSQCSAYGLAKSVAKANEVVTSQLDSVLPCLVQLGQEQLGHAQADKDVNYECEREGVAQNAVMALGYIVTNYQSAVSAKAASGNPVFDLNKIARMWLERLPLRSDEGGSKISAKLLCDALSNPAVSPFVLGGNNTNMPEVIRIFAETFLAASQAAAEMARTGADTDALETLEFAHKETVQRMRDLLRVYSADASMSAQLQSIFPALKAEHQDALRSVMA